MFRFQDLTVEHFREIRARAGGLIVLLPDNLSPLSAERKQVSVGALIAMASSNQI